MQKVDFPHSPKLPAVCRPNLFHLAGIALPQAATPDCRYHASYQVAFKMRARINPAPTQDKASCPRIGIILNATWYQIQFAPNCGLSALWTALQHYQQKDGDVDKSAPVDFLSAELRAALTATDGKFRISLYKAPLYVGIADSMKSGAFREILSRFEGQKSAGPENPNGRAFAFSRADGEFSSGQFGSFPHSYQPEAVCGRGFHDVVEIHPGPLVDYFHLDGCFIPGSEIYEVCLFSRLPASSYFHIMLQTYNGGRKLSVGHQEFSGWPYSGIP